MEITKKKFCCLISLEDIFKCYTSPSTAAVNVLGKQFKSGTILIQYLNRCLFPTSHTVDETLRSAAAKIIQ